MTRTEVELISVLVLIYVSDCVYWLGPTDQAFTRESAIDWSRHRIDSQSFMLLKKMPVLSDPLLICPGFIRNSCSTSSRKKPPLMRDLRKIAKRMNRLWFIKTQCRVQAILLLIFLPAIIYTGRLTHLWPIYLVTLTISHVSLLLSFFLILRKNRLPKKAIALLAINPVGATRLLDVVSQLLYNQISQDQH